MQHVPIRLPDLLSADDAPVFGQWLVDDGDSVLAGDRVAEVLLEGVLIYVASPAEGTLTRSDIRPGADVTVGTTLGVIVTNSDESLVD